MKIGFNGNLGFSDAESWGKALHDAGVKAANFPVKYTADEATIQSYVDAAKKYDITIAEVGAWSNMISYDETVRKAALEKNIGQYRMADRIGALCCVNIAGAIGEVWDGCYKENLDETTWDRLVETVQYIIDTVQPKNTYYCLEAQPWVFPTGPDEYLKLIQDINRPMFKVHLDICNWMTSPQRYLKQEEFMEECFQKLGNTIISCHLKNVHLLNGYPFQLQEVSVDQGELNLKKYIELAESVNPDMPILIEHLTEQEEYFEALEYVRKNVKEF